MKHYLYSHITLGLGLIAGYFIAGIPGMVTVAILIALEVSLSFDNAVVNAKVLENMSEAWRKRFITYGIPIAVFGMRFLFPILIVAIATGMSMVGAFDLAMTSPEQYQVALEDNKTGIFAFGGAFLLMIFLGFFFDDDREEKWISYLENHPITTKMSQVESMPTLLTGLIGLGLAAYSDSFVLILAYFSGMLLHIAVGSLDDLLSTNGVRSGIAGFLYLEVLDASFSFDGVIGAFAVTGNIFIIMIGLGVGAMYVRSMTLHFVDKGTLQEYKYLEHGAHYAIGALAAIMLTKIFFHVPEAITGLVGVGFILIAFLHSKYIKTQEL